MATRKWQIIFSGVGGQGLMLAGNIMGRAAVEFQGLNAVMTSVYGVETRGTFTKSDLIISPEQIAFPEVQQPDVVIALDAIAYNRYVASLPENCLLIYDSAIAPGESPAKQLSYPIAEKAKELGNPAVANVISLGILVGLTQLMDVEAMQQAISNEFSNRANIAELNLKAFASGLAMVS